LQFASIWLGLSSITGHCPPIQLEIDSQRIIYVAINISSTIKPFFIPFVLHQEIINMKQHIDLILTGILVPIVLLSVLPELLIVSAVNFLRKHTAQHRQYRLVEQIHTKTDLMLMG
jgi:hypothetical protein